VILIVRPFGVGGGKISSASGFDESFWAENISNAVLKIHFILHIQSYRYQYPRHPTFSLFYPTMATIVNINIYAADPNIPDEVKLDEMLARIGLGDITRNRFPTFPAPIPTIPARIPIIPARIQIIPARIPIIP
jgi:hypothetical protein